MSDFLALDGVLHTLLDNNLGAVNVPSAHVLSADQIQGEHDLTEYCPGVIIDFEKAPSTGSPRGLAAAFDQEWKCVVIVDATKTTGKRAAEIGGPIVAAVIDLINGHQISDGQVIACTSVETLFALDGYAEYAINLSIQYAQAAGVVETL